MFDFVRSHTRLFQGILVLLIFPSFVFFGVQGYSSFRDGASANVATVAGRAITQRDWDTAHQRNVERFRSQMPNIDAKLLDTPAARQETLDGLVRERLLMAAAEKQHLLPGDERLKRLFASDPQFQSLRNPDGTVNRDILAAQGMSSETFAQQLRLELGMRQVLAGVSDTGLEPKAATQAALDALTQRREIQIQYFDSKDYTAKVKPSDADLEAYFKANESQFKLPEQADIEYVVLDVEGLKGGLSVPESDLTAYYNQNIDRYSVAQERRASHILIKADKDAPAAERAKAKARAEELMQEARKAPAGFADLARKNSQDEGSAVKGGDLDFFGRGAMVKPFEDAAFAMKAGEISNVIESDFGFHVIRLEAVRGGDKKPFEAVRADIEAEVKRGLAQRKFAESAEVFTNTVYEQSESLQPVVDKLKLEKRVATVRRTPAPDAKGPLASPKLLEAIFATDAIANKRNTDAVDLGNSQLVSARIVKHLPARTQPLADVLPQVRERVVQAQAAAQARTEGLAQLTKARSTADLSLGPTQVVSRNAPQGLPRSALEAALQADAAKLPLPLGMDLADKGYAVMRVLKVLPPDEAASAARAALGTQVAQAWSGAETAAYYESLKKRFQVDLKAPAALAADAAASAAAAAAK